MINIKHIVVVLMLLLFAGCQSDNIIMPTSVSPSNKINTITASVAVDPVDTRVAIDGTSVKWIESDLLYVAKVDSLSEHCVDLMAFEIMPGSISDDGKNASFQATNDNDYIYPNTDYIVVSGRNVTIDANGKLSIKGKPGSQGASGDDSYIEDVWFMDGTIRIDDAGVAVATLEHCISMLKLDMRLLAGLTDIYHLQSVELSSSVNCLSLDWLVSCTNSYTPEVSALNGSNISVDISGSPAIGSEDSYVVCLPIFSTGDKEPQFNVLAATTEGDYLQATFSAKALTSGKLYTKDIELTPVKGWYLSEISPGNYPSGNLWIILDSDETAGSYKEFLRFNTGMEQIADENTTVVFPNLETIPDKAFNMHYVDIRHETEVPDINFKNISSISFPSVKTVGNEAFRSTRRVPGLSSITNIDLPLATTIGDLAFCDCVDLTHISLPSAKTIGESAFACCEALVDVDLPSATTIGDYAFKWCKSLANIKLPSATAVGSYVFQTCDVLVSIDLPSALTIGDFVAKECRLLADVNLPSVQTIGADAFSSSDSLTKFVSKTVVTIGDRAFYTTPLTELDIPSAEHIGHSAFSQTPLKKVDLPSALTISDCAFRSCGIQEVNLPSATTIGANAFASNHSVVNVNIPSATSIGDKAFTYCEALVDVYMPLVETVGPGAFSVCRSLLSADLPNATSIGNYAFSACDVLKSVSMPNVVTMGAEVFERSNVLKTLSLPSTTTLRGRLVYFNNIEELYIPNLYKLEKSALSSCNLKTLTLALDHKIELVNEDDYVFWSSQSHETSLTIGRANASYVNGRNITLGSHTYSFRSITLK